MKLRNLKTFAMKEHLCPDNNLERTVDLGEQKVNYYSDIDNTVSQLKSTYADFNEVDHNGELKHLITGISDRQLVLKHLSINEEVLCSEESCFSPQTLSSIPLFSQLDASDSFEEKLAKGSLIKCENLRCNSTVEAGGNSAKYATKESGSQSGDGHIPHQKLDISETSEQLELFPDDSLNKSSIIEYSDSMTEQVLKDFSNEEEIIINTHKESDENISYPGYHLRAGGGGRGHPFGCVTLVRPAPCDLNRCRPELGDRSNNIRTLVDDLKGRVKELRDSLSVHAVENLHYLRDINFKQMAVVDNIEQHNTNEQERIVFEQRQSGVRCFDPHPVADEFYSIQWKQQNIDQTLLGCTEVRECDERDFRRISQPVGYHCFTPCPCPVKGLQFADGRDDIKGEEMYSRHRKHHSFGQFNDGSGCFENRESDDVDLKRRAAGSQVTIEHPLFPTHNCYEGIEYSFDFDKNCGSEEIFGQHKQQVSVGQSHTGYYNRNDKNCEFIRTSRPDPYQPAIPDPGYPPPFPPFYHPGYPVYSLSPTNPCQSASHLPPCSVTNVYYPIYELYNPYDTYEYHTKHRHIDKNESGTVDVSEEHHTKPCPPPCCCPPENCIPAGKDNLDSPKSSRDTNVLSDALKNNKPESSNLLNTDSKQHASLLSDTQKTGNPDDPQNCDTDFHKFSSPGNRSPAGAEKLNFSISKGVTINGFSSPRNNNPVYSDSVVSPRSFTSLNVEKPFLGNCSPPIGENYLSQKFNSANTDKIYLKNSDSPANLSLHSPQNRSPAGAEKQHRSSKDKKTADEECPENKMPEDVEDCCAKQKEYQEYPNPKWHPPCKYRPIPEPFPESKIDFEPGEDYSRHTKCRSVESSVYGCLDIHETEQLEERKVVPHFVYCPFKPLPPCPPCIPCPPYPNYCPDQVFPQPKEEGPYDEEDEERFLKHMRYRQVDKSVNNCMDAREVELMDERTQYKVCNPCCVDPPEPDPNCKLPNEPPPTMKSQFGVPDPDEDPFCSERYTIRSRYRSVDKTDEGCIDVIEKEHREDKRYIPPPCDKPASPPCPVPSLAKVSPCPKKSETCEPEMVPFPDELFTQFSKSRSAGRTCHGFYDCIEKENRESVRLIHGWELADKYPAWDSPERFLPEETEEKNSSQTNSSERFTAGSDAYYYEKRSDKASSPSRSQSSEESMGMLKSLKTNVEQLTSSDLNISFRNSEAKKLKDESLNLTLSSEKEKLKLTLIDSNNNSVGSGVEEESDGHDYISLRGGGIDDDFNDPCKSGFDLLCSPYKNDNYLCGCTSDRKDGGSDRYNTGQEFCNSGEQRAPRERLASSGPGCSYNSSEGSPAYQYQSPCGSMAGNAVYSDQDNFEFCDGCGITDVSDLLKEEIKRLRKLNEETLAMISAQHAPPLVRESGGKKNLHCYINKLVTECQPDINEILRKRIIEGVLEFVNSNSSWIQLNVPPEDEEPGHPPKTINFQVNGVYKFNRTRLLDDTQGPGLTITGMQILPPCDSGSSKSKAKDSSSKTKPTAEEKDSKSGSRTESNAE